MVYIKYSQKMGTRVAKDRRKKQQCGESSRGGEEKGMASNAMPFGFSR